MITAVINLNFVKYEEITCTILFLDLKYVSVQKDFERHTINLHLIGSDTIAARIKVHWLIRNKCKTAAGRTEHCY